jgi:hypothetical protein
VSATLVAVTGDWRSLACLAALSGSACGPNAGSPTDTSTGSGSDSEADGVESSAACPVGSESCPCTDGGGCDPGLTCLSNVCVALPSTTSEASTSADASTAATSDTPTTSDTTSGATTVASSSEGGTGEPYSAVGPQTNVAVADVVGWEVCWSGPYDGVTPQLDDILDTCDGAELMLACRYDEDDFYTVLAHAPREDVLMEMPWPFTPHVANGSGWYYWAPNGVGEMGAWGFVNAGDVTSNGVCDFDNDDEVNSDLRLCWHTQETFIAGGFRCGATYPLNKSMLWTREILHR